MRRLKGNQGSYAQNANRAARSLLMNAGDDYKQTGDFKVCNDDRKYTIKKKEKSRR